MKFFIYALLSICFIVHPVCAQEKSCDLLQAVYRPHPSFYKNDQPKYKFEMTIKLPPEGKGGSMRWLDYYIHVYGKNEKGILNYKMENGCAGGSITMCRIGGSRYTEMNGDLSVFDRSYAREAPPVYIIPSLNEVFFLKPNIENYEFLDGSNAAPKTKVPTVWVLNCKK